MAKRKFSGRRPGKATEWAAAWGKPIDITLTFESDQPPRYGPSGRQWLSIEPAHNGLVVRSNHPGQERYTLVGPNDTAVFTDAEAFGRWMTEHFRQHLRNGAAQDSGAEKR